jgi:hypothetical protein
MNKRCMKEAMPRAAIIDDVDKELFISFCEFDYVVI